MVDFKAKIYKRDKLVGESKGDFIEFYDIYIDGNVKMFLERGTQCMTKSKFIGWLEESRCINRHRVDVEDVLKYYGVSHYDPLLIVQKTKGSMYPLDEVTIEITDLVYSEDW